MDRVRIGEATKRAVIPRLWRPAYLGLSAHLGKDDDELAASLPWRTILPACAEQRLARIFDYGKDDMAGIKGAGKGICWPANRHHTRTGDARTPA